MNMLPTNPPKNTVILWHGRGCGVVLPIPIRIQNEPLSLSLSSIVCDDSDDSLIVDDGPAAPSFLLSKLRPAISDREYCCWYDHECWLAILRHIQRNTIKEIYQYRHMQINYYYLCTRSGFVVRLNIGI